MALPNTQKITFDKSQAIKSDWYEAVLIGHVEKDNQNIISSHIEFDLVGKNKHIWAVLAHTESDLYRIKSLKDALDMADDESDLRKYYNQKVMVYVDNTFRDNKIVNEIKAFNKFVEPAQKQGASPKPEPKKEPVVQPKAEKPVAASPKITPAEPTENGSGSKIPKLILIVDDQPEVAMLIGNYVEQIGFIPDIVATVDEALLKFNPNKYLMVISDVIMPGKNGFDLVRGLHNKYPDVTVALISGYFDKEMENLQKLFGIDKVYRKPVFFKSVKEMVATALQKLPHS